MFKTQRFSFFTLAILALCAAAAPAIAGDVFTLSSLPRGMGFVSYGKNPGAEPLFLYSESTVVSVYRFNRNMAPSVSPDDWDGEKLNIPGFVGPYAPNVLYSSNLPSFVRENNEFAVVISNTRHPDWFALAFFGGLDEMRSAVSEIKTMLARDERNEPDLEIEDADLPGEVHFVPEPSTMALTLAGLAILIGFRDRKRRVKQERGR